MNFFIQLLAILAFIWIVIKNQNQQVIAIFCLLIFVIGIDGINRLILVAIEKIRRIKKGKLGGFEFDETVESDKPKDIIEIGFHRLVAAGKNYLAENFIQESVKCFEDALKIKPDDLGIHNILGFIYGEKVIDKKKAIHHCKRALEIDPNFVSAKFNLAIYTNHLKGFQYSLPLYEEAEELIKQQGPTDSEIYGKLNLFIGHDFRNTGSKDEARERYEKAISILRKLAEQGDQSSAFWLKDAEKNLKELLDEIEVEKKKHS